MLRYGLRLLGQVVPTLLVVSMLTFVMIRLVPGDPAVVIAGDEATPDVLRAIRERLALDRSLPAQYLAYVSGILKGDLGSSIRSKQSVAAELAARIPATLELALAATLIFTVLGTLLGVTAAVRNRWPDHLVRVLSLVPVSTPAFWLGVVLVVDYDDVEAVAGATARLVDRPPANPGLADRVVAAHSWDVRAAAYDALA